MSDQIDLNTSSENLEQPLLAAPLQPCSRDDSDASPFDEETRQVDRTMISSTPSKNQISDELISRTTLHKSASLNDLAKDANFEQQIIVVQDSVLNESSINASFEAEPSFLESPLVCNLSQNLSVDIRGQNSFIRGMSTSLRSNCSSANSAYSDNSDFLNRAFIESCVLNNSRCSAYSDSNDRFASPYRDGKNSKRGSLNNSKNSDFVAGNFGNESMNNEVKNDLVEDNFVLNEARSVLEEIAVSPTTSVNINSSFDLPDLNILPPSDDESDRINGAVHSMPSKTAGQKVEEKTAYLAKKLNTVKGETKQEQIEAKENEKVLQNTIINLEQLIHSSLPIDSPTRNLIQNLSMFLNKISANTVLGDQDILIKLDAQKKQGLVSELYTGTIPKTKSAMDAKNKMKRRTVSEPVSKKGLSKSIIPLNNIEKVTVWKKDSPLGKSPAKSTKTLLNVSNLSQMVTSTPISHKPISKLKSKNESSKFKSGIFKFREEMLKSRSPCRSLIPIKAQASESLIPDLLNSKKEMVSKSLLLSPLKSNNQNLRPKQAFVLPRKQNSGFSKSIGKENEHL